MVILNKLIRNFLFVLLGLLFLSSCSINLCPQKLTSLISPDSRDTQIKKSRSLSERLRRVSIFELNDTTPHWQTHFIIYYPNKNRAFLFGYYSGYEESCLSGSNFGNFSFYYAEHNTLYGKSIRFSSGDRVHDDTFFSLLSINKMYANFFGFGYIYQTRGPHTGPSIRPPKKIPVFTLQSEITYRILSEKDSKLSRPMSHFEIIRILKSDDIDYTELQKFFEILGDPREKRGVIDLHSEQF
jgi:hypothetical protein